MEKNETGRGSCRRSACGMTDYLWRRAAEKQRMGKVSAADVYRATAVQFGRFLAGKRCLLREMNATRVADFRSFLQGKGLRTNTVNSYLSTLRAAYNAACHEGLVRPREHPFAGLKLRREVTAKRAVSIASVRQIAELLAEHLPPAQELAADMATFSFLACGMPFVDIAHLTRRNLQGDTLIYYRRKTGIQIRIGITQGMRRIIRKYAARSNGNGFLFPILPKAQPTHREYKQCLAAYNRQLERIGRQLRFPARLTSYVLRHSWASEALRCHVPVTIISQALGHTSEHTTRCYLSKLDSSELVKANRRITREVDKIVGNLFMK